LARGALVQAGLGFIGQELSNGRAPSPEPDWRGESSPAGADLVQKMGLEGADDGLAVMAGEDVVRGLEWELEGKKGGNNGEGEDEEGGENYHDRHAVLYLGFTLIVLVGRQGYR